MENKKQITPRAIEKIKEVDRTMQELFIASVNQRGRDLKRAIDDGWFVPFLRGAELTGLIIANIGEAINDKGITGFGLGITGMAGIYDLGVAYTQKENQENTNIQDIIKYVGENPILYK